MKKISMNNLLIRLGMVVGLLVVAIPVSAQKYPERREVRKGNRMFEEEQYDGSIERYRRALVLADSCWEAALNLGNALYQREVRLLEREEQNAAQAGALSGMQQANPGMSQDVSARFDEAVELLQRAATDSLRSKHDRAEAYYNLGGVQFVQQKLQESLQSLRNSLRLNPEDEDAKFNYTYVKRLLEQQQDQQDQQQDQQQQNQDQSGQEQPQEQNDDQQEQNEDQQEQNEDQQPNREEPASERESEPQEGEISPQEQAQMLDAIQAQEDETQEKLKEKRGVVVRGTKNW